MRSAVIRDTSSRRMPARSLSKGLKAGAILLSFTALAGCDDTASFGQSSFLSQYSSARDALEKGKYDQANRGYLRLLPVSGSLQPRVRLELAHSYLRGGDFALAGQEARIVAGTRTGTNRSAAMAVHATADHELGLQALNAGDKGRAKALLKQASKDMKTVLRNDPELDPLGALAGRRASIAVRLKSL